LKKRNISLAILTLAAGFTIGACTGAIVEHSRAEKNIVENSIIEKAEGNAEEVINENITSEDVTSFADYVINEVSKSNDAALKAALKRIVDSEEDTESCIMELENIYRLAIIPRCATEEEWDSVIHLRGTLSEMENPFDVYYRLAIFVHTLTCEEEHYTNEFGQTECKTLRKEMEIGPKK
jgi:hypothetical protein